MDFVLSFELVRLFSAEISLGFPVAGLPNELHESVEGSRLRRLTPKRELASSTLGSVFDTSVEGANDADCDNCIVSRVDRVDVVSMSALDSNSSGGGGRSTGGGGNSRSARVGLCARFGLPLVPRNDENVIIDPSVVVRWRCNLFRLCVVELVIVTPPEEFERIICGCDLTTRRGDIEWPKLLLFSAPVAGDGGGNSTSGSLDAIVSLISGRDEALFPVALSDDWRNDSKYAPMRAPFGNVPYRFIAHFTFSTSSAPTITAGNAGAT